MKLIINGETQIVADAINISQLIEMLELQNKRLAVEVNQELIFRSDYDQHILQADDVVEIVQAIGGG